MSKPTQSEPSDLPIHFQIGEWHVQTADLTISRDGQSRRLDPKVMDLLILLSAAPNRVFSKDEIFDALWPDVIVGEDTLAKTVSRLRKALGDTASAARFIVTVPKRGYKLIAPVTSSIDPKNKSGLRVPLVYGVATTIALLVIGGAWLSAQTVFSSKANPGALESSRAHFQLTSRADDLYMRFTRADNESAIALYEQALVVAPDDISAQAGLANAMVQRVVRWSDLSPNENITLQNALEAGVTEPASAKQALQRAEEMAERALRRSPNDVDALKAYGFVLTAQERFDEARSIYKTALEMDPVAWPVLINLAELELIDENTPAAISLLERAYGVMNEVYLDDQRQIGVWQVALGIEIGTQWESLGDKNQAERWYREVLRTVPFNPEATNALATILDQTGRATEAAALCAELGARLGGNVSCSL